MKKDKEIWFVRNPRGKGDYSCWIRRERNTYFLQTRMLASVNTSSWKIFGGSTVFHYAPYHGICRIRGTSLGVCVSV